MTAGVPLDAAASLEGEPWRWRARKLPNIPNVLQICVQRDDGLVVTARESLSAWWPVRSVAIFTGQGEMIRPPRDAAKVLLKAIDRWIISPEARVLD